MTLYRTIKFAVALLLAVQLGVSFNGSNRSVHALQGSTPEPSATALQGGISGHSEHGSSVSFATLIYQAYP